MTRKQPSTKRILLTFGILGPLVASLPIGLLVLMGGPKGQFVPEGLYLSIFVGYALGLPRALVAGAFFRLVALGLVAYLPRWLAGVVLGAASGGIASLAIHLITTALTDGHVTWDSLFVHSVVAGAACGFLCLPPNNSFKPKPLRGSA